MQIIIDGCKREYEVDGIKEIQRIKGLEFMKTFKGKDFPEFMKNTRKVAKTKNGKFRPTEDVAADRAKIANRINEDLYCPMNVLIHELEDIKSMNHIALIPTKNFFVKFKGKADNRQMGKIASLVEEYSYQASLIVCDKMYSLQKLELLDYLIDDLLEKLNRIKISNPKTLNRLIETSLGLGGINCRSKSLTILKMCYQMNKDVFLQSFLKGDAKNA